MEWIVLIIAGLFEIVMAVTLKYSEGFSKLIPSIFTIVSGVISFGLLSFAMRSIPMGTAYAVWTGIGACGTVLFGILFLQESTDLIRLICIVLIIASIIGLKLAHGH